MTAGVQKKRLGRGLVDLLDDAADIETARGIEGYRMVPLATLKANPQNPRRHFAEEELAELAASIGEKGVVQPLVVRPAEGGTYEIVAGERRWRAAQRAQLHQVPAIVRQLSDREALELAIIENVQRSDLNAIEEARGYQQLIEAFNHTQEELAQIIGKSRSHLANMLRLLKLPDGVQDMIREGQLSAGHARALIGRDNALKLAKQIIAKAMSVRAVEALVKADEAPRGQRKAAVKDADTRAAESELSDALGLSVTIQIRRGEAGELRIAYRNLDQLNEVRRRLLKL
jgi:ParB family chromosome partitioning protein